MGGEQTVIIPRNKEEAEFAALAVLLRQLSLHKLQRPFSADMK